MKDSSRGGEGSMQEVASLHGRIAELEQELSRYRLVQDRLLISEERFRSIFENSLDAILLTMPTGEILSANRAAQALLDMTEEEIRCAGRAGVVVQDEALTAALEAMENMGEWRGMLTCRRKDGSTFPTEVSSNNFGEPYRRAMTILIIRDITERMRLEEELRVSVRKYRDIFENVPVGLYQVSPEGRFIRANDYAARILGYDSSQELMETITDIATQIYMDPAKRNEAVRLLEENGRLDNFEVECRHKDGSPVWVSFSAKVVRDGLGNIICHEGVSQDSTERKRFEEALKESEEKYRSLLDNLSTAVVMIEPILDGHGRLVDLRYLMANPAVKTHLGRTPDELVGKLYSEVFSYKGRNPVFDLYEKVLFSGEPFRGDLLLPALNKYFDLSVHRLLTGRLALALWDITERKKTEEELAQYRERLEALVKERTRELEDKTQVLEELNSATKVLLRHREEDRKELEERFVTNMKNLILPYVEKLKSTRLDERQMSYLSIVETHLGEVLSPLVRTMQHLNLTPTESRVASLIKDGKTTKEIAAILEVATSSIDTHRKSMRKKLGLNNAKVNLQSHLRSMEI